MATRGDLRRNPELRREIEGRRVKAAESKDRRKSLEFQADGNEIAREANRIARRANRVAWIALAVAVYAALAYLGSCVFRAG